LNPADAKRCGSCRSFRNDAASLEQAFPGLLSMGSAHGSVRVQDGLCDRHGIYLPHTASCPDHTPSSPASV